MKVITNIITSKDGYISLLGAPDGTPHGIPDDDHNGWVEISGVEGCLSKNDQMKKLHGESINGLWRVNHTNKKVIRNDKEVEVFDAFTLKVGDLTGFTEYILLCIYVCIVIKVEVLLLKRNSQ